MLALLALLMTAAADPAAAVEEEPVILFTRDVSPLLQRWCVPCHGADEPHGGLRLDSFEGLMRGGDSGPPVVARDPGRSLLIAKVERRDRPPMPPRRRLPPAVVAKLRAWIAGGARN